MKSCWLLHLRRNVYDLATPARAELDLARSECEQSVVLPFTDIVAGMELGAPLTDDDLACVHLLAAEALDTEALRI